MSQCWLAQMIGGAVIAAVLCQAVQAQGIPIPRQPNTELLIDELPATSPGTLIPQRVFNNVSVDGSDVMTHLAEIPDGSGRMILVQKSGLIRVFPRTPEPQPADIEDFLDLTAQTCTEIESGAYSMAFDPGYATNGRVYVCYVPSHPRCTLSYPSAPWRLSRFTNANPAGNFIDPATEEVLIEEVQDHSFHKGGRVVFGPDGYLYVSLGDGAGGVVSQSLTDLRGSILRIDVTSTPDPGLPYHIPADNPFYGVTDPPGVREEIYAIGLRNPWTMSFHAETDDLFVADVGHEGYEEIDLIVPGANYGWPYYEGTTCIDSPACNSITQTPPFAGYPHAGGFDAISISETYTGPIGEIYGLTFFADIQGNLFSFRHLGGSSYAVPVQHPFMPIMPIAFGSDALGEVYALQGYHATDNGIYKIVPSTGGSDDFPTRLSQLPAFLLAGSGQGHLVDGVVPYQPGSQLWSDGAHKERYLALPGLSEIEYTPAGGWDFPEETLLIKNFLIPADDRQPLDNLRRIETRLLMKKDGAWSGFTYEWNEEQTDALLLTQSKDITIPRTDSEGVAYNYTWHFPSRNECTTCHTSVANHALGLSTPAMNHDYLYQSTSISQNQLAALDAAGFFDGQLPDEPDDLPRMPPPDDIGAALEARARSYMAMNCSMCHAPGGPTPAAIDLRWESTNLNAINILPTRGDLGIPNARIIDPGSLERSVLYQRMISGDPAHRMPPLATSLVDTYGSALIAEWILSLGGGSSAGETWASYE